MNSSCATGNKKVFISYSHDSEQHKDRVLALSDRLRKKYGIDCIIDQYEVSPPVGWPFWCENQIEEADFVLVVCTGTYLQRFKRKDTTDKGKGAKWEGAIITQELYQAQGRNEKFIPVIFTPEDKIHIPSILRGVTCYEVNTDEGYNSLYRHLTSQPLTPKPELGKVIPMPPRQRIQDFPPGSEIEKPKTGFWNIPFQRNPFFTGREYLFEKLHEALSSDKMQVINGLGGMGKTQTAVEYAYRYRNEYKAVLWSKADSRDALFLGFSAIAQVLDLLAKDEKDQSITVAAVRLWLDRNQQWLLILDNADDPAVVPDFIPQNINGHILLTSRATVFDNIGIVKPEEIKKMTPIEAEEFLIKRTGQAAPSLAEKAALLEIAKELDYLPLALEQAGAYINRVQCSFSTYLSSYRIRGLKLLSQSLPVAGKYPESVATTWLLNFEMVKKANKASADILKFSAFLNPDNIPLELIAQGASELGKNIQEALSGIEQDALLLDELLVPLTQYSLITRDAVLHTYSIHRLVQAVIRDRMKDAEKRMWAERTVKAVNLAFPDVEFRNWHLCDLILPHALVCAGFIDEWDFEFQEAARLLNEAGLYHRYRARYQEAERLYERALAIYEQSLGRDHPDVAMSLNNLAALYYAQGRYDKAEPLYERALAIFEKSLGSDHPDVATSLNNLAELYRAQGRYDEAEPLYERALAIREQSLGRDHPDVATSLNNLAALYDEQGRFDKAESLYERALAIHEQSLGRDHPDVAKFLNNLAVLYDEQGRFDKAEPLYERALAIFEKSLGSDHPDVATSLNNLAALYDEQGRYDKAEPLYERALTIYEQSLGRDHPDVATFLNNLAGLYRAQGRFDKAEPLYERALAIREQSLGRDHPDVAQSLNNLAGLYYMQGMYDKAESMYERTLTICKKTLGDMHPTTTTISQNLAELIRKKRG